MKKPSIDSRARSRLSAAVAAAAALSAACGSRSGLLGEGSSTGGSGGSTGGGSGVGGVAGIGGGPGASEPCARALAETGSVRCEFFALNLDVKQGAGACLAVAVVNSGSTAARLNLRRGGQEFDIESVARVADGHGANLAYVAYDQAGGLAPGATALLFLSHEPGVFSNSFPACPAQTIPALATSTALEGTGVGSAFEIEADAPVVAYQFYPFGAGSTANGSATRLSPTVAWGDRNMAITPPFAKGDSTLEVIAVSDATEVTMVPVAPFQGGPGIPAGSAGAPFSQMLDAGDYLQLSQGAGQTGAPVSANRPIALMGGAFNICVQNSNECDFAQQQIPVRRTLGSRYVAVPHRSRKGDEVVPFRVVGTRDGTQLTYQPSVPPGAPSELSAGEVATISTPKPFVVASQGAAHPFFMSVQMVAASDIEFGGIGGSEWAFISATRNFRNRYWFFTDPTYSETHLTVVRKRGAGGQFAPVELDCAGALSGWSGVGDFELSRFDITRDGLDNGACADGTHSIASSAPFGVTVWGWNKAKGSYAFSGSD